MQNTLSLRNREVGRNLQLDTRERTLSTEQITVSRGQDDLLIISKSSSLDCSGSNLIDFCDTKKNISLSAPNIICTNLSYKVNLNLNTTMSFDVKTMLRTIPEFDGNSELLHKFLTCSDVVYESATNDKDKKLFFSILKSKLNGRAYDLVKYKTCDNWEDLKKEFKLNFSDTRSIEFLQNQLVNSKQLKQESVKDFACKIEKLLADLNDACIEQQGREAAIYIKNLNKNTALHLFQDGLKDPIKLLVKACRFPTLRETVSKAIEEDGIQIEKDYEARLNSRNFNHISKCQLCHKVGHTAPTCFSLNNSSRPINSFNRKFSNLNLSKSQPAIRQISIQCAYCKIFGHTIDVCRKRKRNEYYKNDRTPSNNSNVYTTDRYNPQSSTSGNLSALEQDQLNTTVRVKDI